MQLAERMARVRGSFAGGGENLRQSGVRVGMEDFGKGNYLVDQRAQGDIAIFRKPSFDMLVNGGLEPEMVLSDKCEPVSRCGLYTDQPAQS